MGQKLRKLDRRVRDLGYATFDAYVASRHWAAFLEWYHKSDCVQACVACDDPEFRVYHATYKNLGREGPADVLPLCLKCYRQARKRDAKWSEVDRTLQRHHGWDDAERVRRFGRIPGFFDRGPAQRFGHKPIHNNMLRSACDFPKLAKDLPTLCRYVEDGYTAGQLASMYGVDVKYVRRYLNKYPEYFTKCANET